MNREKIEERKKKLVQFMNEELYVPMKEKEIVLMLQISKKERDELTIVLKELLKENKIQISKRGQYSILNIPVISGTFISHPKGFGFVEIEGQDTDFYVPEHKVNGAFHKDIVEVVLLSEQKGKRQEVEIAKILERGTTQIVGTYQKNKNFGFVVSDDVKFTNDIFISTERSKGAVNGHKVVVEITDYGKKDKKPEGKVIEILGHSNDPGVDIMAMIRTFDIPVEFSEKVMKQIEKVPDQVLEGDKEGRMDLRSLQMVTIDGEDAKDLDDAISLIKVGDNYRLGVHIADVTNYVQENSALDRSAVERGTSVYLVDRVIPMLPHKLSNGICSLNAQVDRLTLTCFMTIAPTGEIIDYEMAETIICIDRRMSYTEVSHILDNREDPEVIKEYDSLVPLFIRMEELSAIIRKAREKRGSIDFDFPETKIILDEKGKPIEIKPYDRNVATKIIEDFMLMANETVAQSFYWMELPFVYRTHDKPDEEKIEKLKSFVYNFGYYIKSAKEDLHPKEFQKLLNKLKGTQEEAMITRLTLRSMKQAKYTVESSGHFGLACDYYCHFTSPIRRYPDLQIHRIIKEYLRGKMKENRIEHYASILPKVAEHSSKMERRAEEAERETTKLKKAEYMEERIGEVFEGIISGITSWGMYVELQNTVEGMIHVSTIPGDYFSYKEEKFEMVGEATGKTYKLGEPITIKVNGVDKVSRNIDFIIEVE